MAIEKRVGKDGRPHYRVRIATTDPVTSKRRNTGGGTFRTRKEAEVAEREAISRRERGTLLDPSTATIATLLDEWLASMAGTITGQTLTDYEIVCRLHLKPVFGSVKVQKLTADVIRFQYRKWQEAGKSPRFVRGAHLRLSQAMNYAISRGLAYTNPCAAVKPPTLSHRKPDVWTAGEAATFLRVAMNRPILYRTSVNLEVAIKPVQSRPDDLVPLWHLLLLEGMRRGEALGLRWTDINWERGTAHIVQTVAPDKTNKGAAIIQDRAKTRSSSRTVRLTTDTLAVLKDHRQNQLQRRLRATTWHEHDLIVCTGIGTPVNPNNVTRSFEALVKAAGLRRIRVHDLRHTHATLLLKAHVPAKVVSERLGHASIAITLDTYSHVLPDMQADAAEAISAALEAGRSGTDG
jgi:integrase